MTEGSGARGCDSVAGTMADTPDVFADSMHITVAAFGCVLQFSLSRPLPPSTTVGDGSDAAAGMLPSGRAFRFRLT